jgi:hypothetical protein
MLYGRKQAHYFLDLQKNSRQSNNFALGRVDTMGKGQISRKFFRKTREKFAGIRPYFNHFSRRLVERLPKDGRCAVVSARPRDCPHERGFADFGGAFAIVWRGGRRFAGARQGGQPKKARNQPKRREQTLCVDSF